MVIILYSKIVYVLSLYQFLYTGCVGLTAAAVFFFFFFFFCRFCFVTEKVFSIVSMRAKIRLFLLFFL